MHRDPSTPKRLSARNIHWGMALIAIGNLLPRTRPNLVIGIRTSGTLADRTLWMRTHRILGYIVVACGLAIIVAAIGVPPPVGPLVVLGVGPVAALCIPAVVFYARRNVRV